MGKSIGQLTAAGAVAGTELIELQKLSATVTITAATLSAAAADNSYNDSGSGFVTAGFTAGMHVRVSGFTGDVANNITDAVVTAVTAGKLTIGGTDGDVIVDDAAGESVTITAWESVYATADQLLADGSITNAKLADMATQTIKGRTTAGTGAPEDLTAAQAATILQGDGLTADLAGFRGIPQNAQTGNYTLVAADAGKHIYHASGAGSGDTYTIPANGSVAFPVGTSITFINMDSNAVSIAITTDSMYLAGTGTTGTRTLAAYGVATAVKITSTAWIISGAGLT